LNVTNTILEALVLPDVEWRFQHDVLFMPIAYVRESNMMAEADALELVDSLYGTEEFVAQLQQWSFIAAGASFAAMVTMYITIYSNPEVSLQQRKVSMENKQGQLDPLLAATGTEHT
jgi:hypothetical protein